MNRPTLCLALLGLTLFLGCDSGAAGPTVAPAPADATPAPAPADGKGAPRTKVGSGTGAMSAPPGVSKE